ncbi:MAG: hypothetical protein HY735_06320 [Verrucomicrobia bacterium]|nr:hypothetical protein [Verrucomicrobiota bacterium]
MKTRFLSTIVLLATVSSSLAQAHPPKPPPAAPPPPPPVSALQPSSATSSEKYVYEQKFTAERPYLVTPDQAQTVINRFKEAYGKMGNPRVLIYVNRELVDDESGMKLSARSEQTEITRGHLDRHDSSGAHTPPKPQSPGNPGNTGGAIVSGDLNKALVDAASAADKASGQTEKVTSKNTYRVRERKQAALADRQTVRDIERLFGRPLRMAGVTLIDQRVATQLIGDKPWASFAVPTEGEAARKDREALAKNADVVLEILISSRQVTVAGVSGDAVHAVPDIQATAIRLKDAKILGQASASDLIGHGQATGKIARNFGVREISEATALALMEDMTQWP